MANANEPFALPSMVVTIALLADQKPT
jgi:hypothetical protein